LKHLKNVAHIKERKSTMIFKTAIPLILFVILVNCSIHKNNPDVSVNTNDSMSVSKFVQSASLCQQISEVEKAKSDIAQEKGYGIVILKSISLRTKISFYLPVATTGIILDTNYIKAAIQTQMDSLKVKLNCPKISN
jgi:hypothetical protein